MRIACWICHKFAAANLLAVLRHIGAVHSRDSCFYTVCGIEGCPRTYRNFFSFKKHVYRHHRESLRNLGAPPAPSQGGSSPDIGDADLDADLDDLDELESECEDQQLSLTIQEERKQLALFILKSKVVHKISQSALEGLLDDISSMFSRKVEHIHNEVKKILTGTNVQLDLLKEVFQSPMVTKPFAGLETRFQQEKYIGENFMFLKPLEIKVGQSLRSVRAKGKTTMKLVSDVTYYVPLLESLKKYLSNGCILEEILLGHKRNDDLLADYCDSPACSSHPLFGSDHTSLQIFLYYDDVEVCNPLGSRTKKHKLALFYYVLGNVSPIYRSTLDSIQLLAVTKSSVLQEYGPQHILGPVMKDVGVLEEEGLSLCVDGIEYNLKGTIALVPGDNLASQYLGGYKALNAALRKCRHCMATAEDMTTEFVADLFQSRTRETHEHQCSTLVGALKEHNSIAFGIRYDSVLNRSKHFHITEGLCPDIMHDVLEGSLAYELKELIRHTISNKIITLEELNASISRFPYFGTDACNKPSSLGTSILSSSDHGLRQSATQIWCLARLLPLMIGEKIEVDSVYWKNFLLQMRIVDYIFAPVVSQDIAAYLRELIEDHHLTFQSLYPSGPITPKMHYMVHYPQWMSKYGPMIRFWVMRFEGKHNFFKDLAHRIKCFRNIPKSMANYHQLYSCYLGSTCFSKLGKEIMTGKSSVTMLSELEYKEALPSCFSLSDETPVNRISWMEVNGIVYKPGGIVVLKIDLVPTFGIIVDILVLDVDNYFLVCEIVSTECFNSHFHAYELEKIIYPTYLLRQVNQLPDHYMLSAYKLSTYPNTLFVSLKYNLLSSSQ